METKFTPGPWHVIEKPNGTLGIGAKEPDGEDCRPAQINGTAIEEPWASVTWANARLIAAAPELLAACQNAVNIAHRSVCPMGVTYAPNTACECNYHAMYDALQAAIAKATAQEVNAISPDRVT